MALGNAPTLADVAAHAGVSLATASRALHPSARTVRPELKRRVAEAAQELGYSVNSQAQAVARGSSNIVSLVVGDIADPYFAAIASGVVSVARSNDLIVTLTAVAASDQEAATLDALRAQRPRAVVFAASRDAEADSPEYVPAAPLVLIGPQHARLRSVEIDNRGGARELALALGRNGYRDFAIVAGPSTLWTVRERTEGFLSVAPTAVVFNDDFSRDGGYRGTARLLAGSSRPQCIFAVADVMAIGAIAAIEDAGLRPGTDIAIAGFDDIPLLRDVRPHLTTVALPLVQIGERAMELALDESLVNSPVIGGTVIIRESTPALAGPTSGR